MKRSGSSSAALLVAVLCVACVADGAAILTVTLFLHFFRIKMASNVFFYSKNNKFISLYQILMAIFVGEKGGVWPRTSPY